MGELKANAVEAVAGVKAQALKFNRFLRILGPGVITGAADDDPSGIATYSQAGAGFGLGMLWTMPFTFPFMTGVQELCARIGAVNGKGLAAVVRDHYPRRLLLPIVWLVVMANVINIGANLGAMAASARLVVNIPFVWLTLIFVGLILVLQIFTSYRFYVHLLKWLALTLLAYPLTVLIAKADWGAVLRATVVPHFELSREFLFILVGVFGTTISPYLFFWQASEVVEEEISEHRLAQKGGHPRLSRKFLRNLRLDTAIGMFVSNATAWFIIITAAVVLNTHGITTINSAADAAKALEPLVRGFPNAGWVAKLIFSSGVVGLGLLAVPVLAGSASYAISETFGWKEGLFRKLQQAHGFYGVIVLATVAGLAINFIGVDPIKALIFTAVFNAIASVPLLYLIARIGRNPVIMGEHRSGYLSHALVWATFIFMTAGTLVLFYSFLSG
jgi:NRAMP (natural resistance-associated macrophage protein)-like metal ion transporter